MPLPDGMGFLFFFWICLTKTSFLSGRLASDYLGYHVMSRSLVLYDKNKNKTLASYIPKLTLCFQIFSKLERRKASLVDRGLL